MSACDVSQLPTSDIRQAVPLKLDAVTLQINYEEFSITTLTYKLLINQHAPRNETSTSEYLVLRSRHSYQSDAGELFPICVQALEEYDDEGISLVEGPAFRLSCMHLRNTLYSRSFQDSSNLYF